MSTYEARLSALREELRSRKLDGFVVPLTDEHMSEYVGAYAQRLAWLTGFEGSAGTAVVLPGEAAIFVDGRYTLQVRDQVDGRLWSYESVPATSVAAWLRDHAGAGARIGYDPWLHSSGWVKSVEAALAHHDGALVPLADNPVDSVWQDRPLPSQERLVVHPERYAGRSSAEKRAEVAEWLKARRAEAVVLSALDSIAWLFNIRGRDVSRTPVALAFAVVHQNGEADLYVDPEKVDADVRAHLGNAVRLHPRDAFDIGLDDLAGKAVAVDPATAVAAISDRLKKAGATIVEARDPVVLPKAIKNQVEIAGSRAAHLRDGAALSQFLHWLSVEAPAGRVTEMDAADRLEAFRKETGLLRDLSFDTISGAGPNGAIVHYRVSQKTNRPIEDGQLYLVDSGAQYLDGTTDVTRTVAIGRPGAEMCDRFTRVLKGHIAIARAIFPKGTRGGQLDVLARQYLWSAGLDYAHGTGHGVGSYLSVHEGPQRIATFGGGDEPLAAGMILSNEPGYYKTGSYGIRIENLVLVREIAVEGAEREMLGFETLTLAPIDLSLVDPSMLDAGEKTWLNDYHARVASALSPLVDDATMAWLQQATRAI